MEKATQAADPHSAGEEAQRTLVHAIDWGQLWAYGASLGLSEAILAADIT